MTREEAKSFLINISYKFGTMDVEYLTEKDGEKTREAIKVLEQETRTGHWVDWDDGFSACECSECKNPEFIKSKYCPNCGIKMDNPREV